MFKNLMCLIVILLSGEVMANPLSDLQQVGKAKLEVFFFDIYYSTLYSADGTYSENNFPLALNIEYLRNIEAKDLVERTQQEWQKLGFSKSQIVNWSPFIQNAWPDIKKTDTLLFKVEQNGSGEFFFNGDSIKKIDDIEFSKAFLAIWLSANSSYPNIRKKLIGK